MACATSEVSDHSGQLPSLISVLAVRMNKAWVLSYPLSTQRRLWSDWADAQADLSSLGAQAVLLVLSCAASYLIYPKYSDTWTTYVSYTLFILKFYCLLICLNCWIRGKQRRTWSDATFCTVWSGSSLFAQAGLSENRVNTIYRIIKTCV